MGRARFVLAVVLVIPGFLLLFRLLANIPVVNLKEERIHELLARNPLLGVIDLFAGGPLWIGSDGSTVDVIGESTRIGITKGADARLRYFVAGSAYLSGSRRLNATSA